MCSEVPLKSIGMTEISSWKMRVSGDLPVKKLWQAGKKKVILVSNCTRIYMQIRFPYPDSVLLVTVYQKRHVKNHSCKWVLN